ASTRDATGSTDGSRRVRPLFPATVPAHGGESENHRGGAGQHHRHHHSSPHEKEWEQGASRPTSARRATHWHTETFTHAAQVHGARFMNHVSPRYGGNPSQRGTDDPTLAAWDRRGRAHRARLSSR